MQSSVPFLLKLTIAAIARHGDFYVVIFPYTKIDICIEVNGDFFLFGIFSVPGAGVINFWGTRIFRDPPPVPNFIII